MCDNFESKYKKYKNKYMALQAIYLKLLTRVEKFKDFIDPINKNKYVALQYSQIGGGPIDEMVKIILSHPDIGRLGKLKPVATPESGQEPRKLITMWENLTESEKEQVKMRIYDEKQIIIGIVITPFQELGPNKRVANTIVFYSEEDLSKLAEVSGKTLGEILDIMIWRDTTAPPINMDIIKIAFGDLYKYPNLSMGKLSQDGILINEIYLILNE